MSMLSILPGSVRCQEDLIHALDLVLQDVLSGTAASTGRGGNSLDYDAESFDGAFAIRIVDTSDWQRGYDQELLAIAGLIGFDRARMLLTESKRANGK
jgi:hypothetical protein